MSDTTWTTNEGATIAPTSNRMKFIVGGILIIAAVGFLIYNAMTQEGATQLYITVNEYYADPGKYAGRDLRISGWVLGDSIQYTQIDDTNSRLEFDVVDDMANPGQRMRIVAFNEPLPDLLQHEAQALVEGYVGEDHAFYANEGGLLLKCPTRYEEADPGAVHPESTDG